VKNHQWAITLVASLLASSSVMAAQFTCNGKAVDDSGTLVAAQITIDVSDDSLSVKEDNGTNFGFAMEATYDANYRPTAKYAGYYRYSGKGANAQGWDDILIQKPMADNKKAKTGAAVLQGIEEDGGMAAYFDTCHRVD
jgi:hypothetical protein